MRRLIWALGLVALLVGCGSGPSSGGGVAAAPDTGLTVAPATEAPTPPPVDTPPTGGAHYHAVGTLDSGYAMAIDIYFGVPHRLSQLPLPPLNRPLVACSGDSSTTTVIPVRVVLTNETPNFSASLTTNWVSEGSGSATVDVSYGAGDSSCLPSADDPTGIFGLKSDNEVAPHANITQDFYLLVPNFYSPDMPEGALGSAVFDKAVQTISTIEGNQVETCYSKTPGAKWNGAPFFVDEEEQVSTPCSG